MKIALVGTASNWKDAPFNDPSWQIWTVSGCYPNIPRVDRVYEVHERWRVEKYCESKEGYSDFMRGIGDRFIVNDNTGYPDARVLDYKKFVAKHGRSPFTSTVSWMLAEAIELFETCEDQEKVVGFWGINMTTGSEYESQRPGARQLIGWLQCMGVKVGCHPGSELMYNSHLYGFEDEPQHLTILKQKKEHMEHMRAQNRAALKNAKEEDLKFEGFIEAINWMQRIKNA